MPIKIEEINYALPLILLLGNQARLFKKVFFHNSSVIKEKKGKIRYYILVLIFLEFLASTGVDDEIKKHKFKGNTVSTEPRF